MKKFLATLALVLGVYGVSKAAVTLPYTFSPGSQIKANEVNANFGSLRDEINTHESASGHTLSNTLLVGNSTGTTPINFNFTQGQNFRFENVIVDPICTGVNLGQAIWNSTAGAFKICNGTSFVSVISPTIPDLATVLGNGNTAGVYNIDLNNNELLNTRLEQLAVDPAPGVPGKIFFNTAEGFPKVDTGASILTISGAQGLSSVLGISNSAGSTDIDFNGNEALNLGLEQLNADPVGFTGRTYFNTVSNKVRVYNGVSWADVSNDGITALTGEVTASGPGSAAATVANSAVLGKVLTGFTSGAGVVADTDTLLQAFNKLDGNIALKQDLIASGNPGDIVTWNGAAWVAGAPSVGGGNPNTVYFDDAASDIGGYHVLAPSPAGGVEVIDSVSVSSGTSPVVIETYATSSSGIGGTQIDGGTWTFMWFGDVDSAVGVTQLRATVKSRTSGGSETTLFTSTSPEFNNSTVGSVDWESVQPAFAISATDRLVVVVEAVTTSGPSRTVRFYHNGTTHYSHIHTPLITRHNDLVGLQGGSSTERYHLSSAKYNEVNAGTIVTSADTIAINKGGTGQTTANAALNALLPDQTGNAAKALVTDGTNTSWSTVSGSGSGSGANNILVNGNFDAGTGSWTAASSTLATEATVKIQGTNSLKMSVAAAAGSVSQSVTTPGDFGGLNLENSCWVNTSVANVQVCSLSAGSEVQCVNVISDGKWHQVIPTSIGVTGATAGVKVKIASGTPTGDVYVDDCFVGPNRNVGSSATAEFVGSVKINTCNDSFRRSTNSMGPHANSLTCASADIENGSTGATITYNANTLSFTVANGKSGTYEFIGTGMLGQYESSGFTDNTNFQFYDGTNLALERNTVFYPNASGNLRINTVNGHFTYSAPFASKTFTLYLQGDGTRSATVVASSSTPFVIKVYRYPTISEQSVKVSTPATSTITRLTSGSGTYTPPQGLKALKVKMVGGGGGGATAGSNYPGGGGSAGAYVEALIPYPIAASYAYSVGANGSVGGAGGTTTFGTSLLTATGGGAGGNNTNSGAGGTATVNAPAIDIASKNGGTGSVSGGLSTTLATAGGAGAPTPFGGAGGGGGTGQAGQAAIANSGSGGGGGGQSGANSGGAGGSGVIIIEEIYGLENAPILIGPTAVGQTDAGMNAVPNPNGSFGLSGWTYANVTPSTDTSTGNKVNGTSSILLSTATHTATFTSDALTLEDNATGACEANVYVKGDGSKWKFYVLDGSNVEKNSVALGNTSYWQKYSVSYPCNQSYKLRIGSTAASPANINVGGFFWGRATNSSAIGQTKFHGAVTWPAAANCSWSRTSSASFAQFTADSDCTNPAGTNIEGNASAPATKIPAGTFTNIVAGRKYEFKATGTFLSGSSGLGCSWRFTDGTDSSQPQVAYNSTGAPDTNVIVGDITFSSGGTKTVEIQGTGAFGSTACTIQDVTATVEALRITAVEYPTAAETVIRPEQTDTQWTSFPMTIGGTTTAPTKATTKIYDNAYWRRQGDSMEIVYNYRHDSNAGAADGSGSYLFTLPSGYSIDATKLKTLDGAASGTGVVGTASFFSSSTLNRLGYVSAFSATQLVLVVGNQTDNPTTVGSTYSAMSASDTRYSFRAVVPIVGWGPTNGVLMSPGNVTGFTAGAAKMFGVTFGDTSNTKCTSSPCGFVYSDIPGVTVTRASTGVYSVNLPVGSISGLPWGCSCSGNETAVAERACSYRPGVSTVTALSVVGVDGVGTNKDSLTSLLCYAPR